MLLAGWWIFFGEMAKEFRDSSTKAGGEFGQNEGFKHEHGERIQMMTWKIGRWSHVARLEPEHVQVNHQKWRFIMVYHGLTMGIKGEYSQ